MSTIFLFIDGVGLGEANDHNPMQNNTLRGFNYLAGKKPLTQEAPAISGKEHFFRGVDATLGVDGLPQSGTGQAALFSGKNAPKIIGKHFGPYPHSGIKHLLRKQSLFIKASEKGKTCTFINAYPDIFFKKSEQRNRWTCTTLMTKSANLDLNGEQEVRAGIAVTAGLTQKAWKEKLDIDVPEISPEDAARRLINQSQNYDLLLHEYYLTDKAGHSQEKEKAAEMLERYDAFLMELIREKPSRTTIVLCSDHGNIEDLSTKTHTLNAVPLAVLGPGAEAFYQAKSIMDVTPGILEILDG